MAIALHPDRTDLAHVVRRPGGRPEVAAYDSYRRDKPEAEALALLRRKRGLRSHRCITALANGEYRVFQLDSPDVPAEEMKEAVRWRIKDMIDYAPEEATLDAVEIPAGPSGGARSRGLHVFCARNEVVGARMRTFEGAGIALEAIDVPEMALRNLAALWAKPGKALALMAFDASGGLLVIVAQGELYATRRIDLGEADLSDPDEGRRMESLERLSLELHRSFDYYDRQFGAAPLERLLVAAPNAQGLIPGLAASLYVPVEAADLEAILDFPRVPELRDPRRQAQGLVALGLALRETEGAA